MNETFLRIHQLAQKLKLLGNMILPHYKSDQPELAGIDKEIEYCKANKIPYRTLSDGEVLFGDNIETLRR